MDMQEIYAKQERKRIEREAMRLKHIADNPDLVPYDGSPRTTPAGIAARNLRSLLRKAYPGVKFSVKASNYAGGSSIGIKWTRLANDEAEEKLNDGVSSIACRFRQGSFDSSTDTYDYQDSVYQSAYLDAFGSARFVSYEGQAPETPEEVATQRASSLEGSLPALSPTARRPRM